VLAVVIAARLGRRLFGTRHELRDRPVPAARVRGRVTPDTSLPEPGICAGGAARDRITPAAGEPSVPAREQEQEQPVAQSMS
jgi:hypothetical protein